MFHLWFLGLEMRDLPRLECVETVYSLVSPRLSQDDCSEELYESEYSGAALIVYT